MRLKTRVCGIVDWSKMQNVALTNINYVYTEHLVFVDLFDHIHNISVHTKCQNRTCKN